MSRTAIAALAATVLASTALAGADRPMTALNFNPALKTVPSIPHAYYVMMVDEPCEPKLVNRIDSATVGFDEGGRVAHITGAVAGGGRAELVITSTSPDGQSATADFVACVPLGATKLGRVAATMPLSGQPLLKSVTVRTESGTVVLDATK